MALGLLCGAFSWGGCSISASLANLLAALGLRGGLVVLFLLTLVLLVRVANFKGAATRVTGPGAEEAPRAETSGAASLEMERSTTLCWYYSHNGYCNRGQRCNFRHVRGEAWDAPPPLPYAGDGRGRERGEEAAQVIADAREGPLREEDAAGPPSGATRERSRRGGARCPKSPRVRPVGGAVGWGPLRTLPVAWRPARPLRKRAGLGPRFPRTVRPPGIPPGP